MQRIVFYTPVGPQFCLKFEPPPKENWQVAAGRIVRSAADALSQANLELGTGILKTVIQLLGPHGEEPFYPADSAVIYVIDTPGNSALNSPSAADLGASGWEDAVDKYQKEVESGNKTEFDSLFNAISAVRARHPVT